MQFRQGATVLGAGGDEVGTIHRIVLDPHTREVTHIVVQRGMFVTEEKVIPMDLVGPATSEEVTLWKEAGDLSEQPDFEESTYVPAEIESHGVRRGPPSAKPLYALPPFVLPKAGFKRRADASPQFIERTKQNIPEGAVALEAGALVVSSDGEQVGAIDRVLVDSETEAITHFIVTNGLLRRSHKQVPVSWISRMHEEQVELAVESAVIERLPEDEIQA